LQKTISTNKEEVKKVSSLKKENMKRGLVPYLFILPNLSIFLIFVVIPAIYGLIYSFTNYDGLSEMNFVGLKNYIKIFKDAEFWSILGRTSLYVVIVVPLIFVFALMIAMYLVKEIRCKGIIRAIFYWPTMISFIVVGFTWKWILGENFGIVNYVLVLMGQAPVKWLTTAFAASVAVIIGTLWSRIGYYMVIFMGGLQSIPVSYYEAATIDGASKRQIFFNITFPLLKPTSLMVVVLSVIDAFKAYPLILALTGGGPGKSTTYLVQYIYQYGFERYEIGYASAMSVILFLILGTFTVIQFKMTKGGEV
jgi:alpha-1,4-digalacturonate transport system permease protein